MGTLSDLAAQISAQLRTVRFGRPLQVHALVTSTNDLARDLAAAGAEEGTVVLALEQSHGRGRLGRRWHSPPGGLYLSVVLRPNLPMEQWPLIGLACALGAAAAAQQRAGVPVRLKWPNDLLLDGRKLGGILIETVGDAAVCGMGLNVIPPRDPTVAAARPADATWLATKNPGVTVASMSPDVLLECEGRYLALAADPGAVLAEWRARSVTLGKLVRVEAPDIVDGVAEDIDADGALLLRTPSGLRRVTAGDISVVRSH